MPKRRGNQKHSTMAIQNALEMIHRGENPFRASKIAGIARTTLLYHLEKMPGGAFPAGINPVIDNIRQQIELLLWKTRLRLIKNIFHKSRKTDEKTSAVIWKYINESPMPSLNASKALGPLLDTGTADDKVTFREFIFERKEKGAKETGEETKTLLAEASLDTPQLGPSPAEASPDSRPEEEANGAT